MEQNYDLKLSNGKIVQWTGTSGENAAARYTDCVIVGRSLDVHVVASRPADDPGVSVLGRGTIIG
jgi:hypothetical protein